MELGKGGSKEFLWRNKKVSFHTLFEIYIVTIVAG